MLIRKAAEEDIGRITVLLRQVLEIHAAIRPDLLIPGTAKYTPEELAAILSDESRRSYVAVDESGLVVGYALCVIRTPGFTTTMIPRRSMFIDDLCVDESRRGTHVGSELFGFVKNEARREGCYDVSLCVWEGNDPARAFYDKMGMRPKETLMELILD